MSRITRTRLSAIVLVGLLVAACSSGTDSGSDTAASDGASDSISASDGTSSSDTTASDGTSGSDSGETSADAPAEGEYVVALMVDGLGLVEASSGSITAMPFGTPKENVLIGMQNGLGEPGSESPGNPECGNAQASVVEWPGTISLDFDDADQFLSWTLRPGSPLTDLTGVGIGSSYEQLTSALEVTLVESTLGQEFATGTDGLGGLLTGTEPDATITDLWAGPICAFR